MKCLLTAALAGLTLLAAAPGAQASSDQDTYYISLLTLECKDAGRPPAPEFTACLRVQSERFKKATAILQSASPEDQQIALRCMNENTNYGQVDPFLTLACFEKAKSP